MSNYEEIHQMIVDLRSSKDYEVRMKAAQALGNSQNHAAVEPLLNALTDPDEDVRVEVLKALGKAGDNHVASRIVGLLSDNEPKVRIEAIKALFALKSIDHIPEIFLRLNDPDWAVRNWAVKTLNRFIEFIIESDTDEGIEFAIGLLKAEEPTLRRKVEESLISSGTKYYSHLLETLERGVPLQKVSISYVLGKIKDDEAIFPLINIINDRDREVRKAVIRALAEIQNHEAISSLIRSLGDANSEVRKEAVRALTSFKESAVLPLVRALIMSRDTYIRQNSALALGDIGDKRAIPALFVSLGDSYFLVRSASEAALYKFGKVLTDKLIKVLTPVEHDLELAYQLIDSPLANERLRGIEFLGFYRDPRSVKVLQRMLHDPYHKIQEVAQSVLFVLGCYAWKRTGAARLIGMLRIAEAIPTLINALDDVDKDVRIEAIRSLGYLRSGEAVPHLMEKLEDKNVDIRRSAAWSLGRIGDVRSLDSLLELLRDPDNEVRFNAIVSLGKLLDQRAVLPLLKMVNQSSYRLKEASINAIKTIGKRAVPIIVTSLEQNDPETQSAIDEVLQMMKDDFTEDMIKTIVPNLTEEQKKYFFKAIDRKN